LKLIRDGRVVTPNAALLEAVRPSQVVVPATRAQVALPGLPARAPQGLAGRDPVEGTVRVADGGRLVTLTPETATALGYATALGSASSELPALSAADFGLPPAQTTLDGLRHVDGTLVRDPADEQGRAWLIEGGVRRLVDPSWLTSYGRRPVLPALPGDPSVQGPAAAPADGAVLRTDDGSVWIVETGVRRLLPAAVAARLGIRPGDVPLTTDALRSATTEGAPVA
ncbi:MAG: hypothetical protein JWN57_1766, partial [Frankiales bacterium]|nr:hypothetical protein [Frankiales bacterium]